MEERSSKKLIHRDPGSTPQGETVSRHSSLVFAHYV